MQKLIITIVIGILCIQVHGQTPDQMTPEKWAEDLAYLNKKIQKQFNSFVPGIKDDFAHEVENVNSRIPKLKNWEVPCEIMRILATLQDGHTELNIGNRTVGFHKVPLSLYFFENELYVLAAHEAHAALIGGVVTKIGGRPTTEVFEQLTQRMSRDNEMEFLHAGPGYLIITELLACMGITDDPMVATFTFQKINGEIDEITFNGLDYASYYDGSWQNYYGNNELKPCLYMTNRNKGYWFQYLPESGIMYCHISRMNNQKGMPSIAKFTKELWSEVDRMKPQKLVIDFRYNNGGNYNLSRPLIDGIKARDWLNQEGRVWAITGRRTFSASSSACIFLKRETKALLIGEPGRTHPNWADNNEYMTLPNSGFLIEYTTKIKVHWPEKPDLTKVPVDVSITPTFEFYREGRDPVLGISR